MRFLTAILFAATLHGQQLPADCVVDGFVVNAATGEPIPRARVSFNSTAGQRASTTDATGQFSFTGATCGRIQLMATRPGFLPGTVGGPRPGTAFDPVFLKSGEPYHSPKIALIPQTVISGKVLDDQGDPLINVHITALTSRVVQGRATFQNAQMAVTSDLGEYRIPGLQSGKYIICAQPNQGAGGIDPADGYTALGTQCYPGPPEAGSALDVRGPDNRVNFTLSRVPTSKIRGSLAGAPRGATVSLVRRNLLLAGATSPARMQPDGTFEFPGVTPGAYMLSTDYRDSGKHLMGRLPINVGGGDIDGVVVRLEPGFAITGTVRVESGQNSTASVPRINLLVRPSDPMTGNGALAWSKFHDSFTISDLGPGSYRIDAAIAPPWYVKRATLAGRDISREEIALSQSAGPVDVVLSDDSGALEGVLEDAEGKPGTGVVMILQDGRPPRNVATQVDGHFKLAGLAPGEYKISGWDDSQFVEYANPDWMRRNASIVGVTISAGQTAQTRLRRRSAPENR
jgi:hypothetical protein